MRIACLLAVVASTAVARADVGRYALIIGANRGDRGDAALRYAESDGQQIGNILRTIGGFRAENVVAVNEGSADDTRRALSSLDTRMRQAGGESLLVVFYSGHADAENLHLGTSRLALAELRTLVASTAATARIAIVDACRSGAMTRVKGGHPGPSFDVHIDAPLGAAGLAILTSSAAGEDSQESDDLGASFFTHYLASGLLGAADRDRDGRVTLSEAFAYASERTLSATAGTFAGPQHPTFRTELAGRNDLVLTQPGSTGPNLGTLEFAAPGSYLVHRADPDHRMVAELASDQPRGRLALATGRYRVTRRDDDHLLEGDFTVGSGASTVVTPDRMQRIDYARVVRKGGTIRRSAASVFLLGGMRGGILDLGTAWSTTAGARLDLSQLSVELRGSFADASHANPRLGIATRETAMSVALVRAFDWRPVALSVGLELGGSWLDQSFDQMSTPGRDAYSLFVAPVAQLEMRLGGRAYLRVDAALLTYFLPSGVETTATGIQNVVTFRAAAGIGIYL